MKNDAQARIEHEIAELRGAYPRVSSCLSALRRWSEGGEPRYSLWLDLRWPEHQSIVSGPTCDSAEAAVQAGLEKARAALESAHA